VSRRMMGRPALRFGTIAMGLSRFFLFPPIYVSAATGSMAPIKENKKNKTTQNREDFHA